MKKSRLLGAVCTILFSFIATSANAALLSRLGGLAYYDTDADLTWLADANYADTLGFTPDGTGGAMDQVSLSNWAAGLTIGGVSGWRLPNSDSCTGTNCSNSEMGNMFNNVLGGSYPLAISVMHNGNYNLFTNIQDDAYWSGTDYSSVDSIPRAYYFHMINGEQDVNSKGAYNHAWAVHSGDVGATVVPIPPALWLFGSGLLGMIGVARKNHG